MRNNEKTVNLIEFSASGYNIWVGQIGDISY